MSVGHWAWVATMALAEILNFDQAVPGQIPAGWSAAMTHTGAPPRWEVVRDPSAPSAPFVLAQTSTDATAGRFPLAIWNGATVRNGEISVAFKAVSGAVDRAAGLVWRYQDPRNYFIARANALENNVVLYKVVNDVRISIAPKGLPSRAYGVKHSVPSGKWQTLRVVFKDLSFTVYLNEERLFEAEDSALPGAGKAGLWTKADSVTYFDNFTIAGN